MIHLLSFLFPKTIAMAVELKKAEDIITGLSTQILSHLIKILYYADETNYQKHTNDVDTWLMKVDKITIKPKSKRLKYDQYFRWLFEEPYDGIQTANRYINKYLVNYNNLPNIRSVHDLDREITAIYKKLCVDLAEDTFMSISDYLPKDYK